jgi:hypothetical protein
MVVLDLARSAPRSPGEPGGEISGNREKIGSIPPFRKEFYDPFYWVPVKLVW